MSGIRLSEKHGVNPAIPLCFFCLEPKNELVLAGRMKGDAEAPKNTVWDMRPCDKCEDWMKVGIICISARGEYGDDPHNPYRTGGWTVIKAEAFERIVGPDHPALKSRFCFIDNEAWDKLGFPARS